MVACFAVFMLLLVAFAAYGAARSGEAYAGVRVAGIDVSGKDRAAIEVAIGGTLYDYASEPMTLRAGDEIFQMNLADAGVSFDTQATIDRALAFGRDGSWWDRSVAWMQAFVGGHDVEPVVSIDTARFDAYLHSVSPTVEFPATNASIDFSGSGDPSLIADIPGQQINREVTRAVVMQRVSELSSAPVTMSLVTLPAEVQVADIEGGLPNAQRAVGSAIQLTADEGAWPVDPETLRSIVSVDNDGALRVDEDQARSLVETAASGVDHDAQDAGITVEDGQFVIIPAVHAATVDVDASTAALIEAIENGETDVPLVVERSEPAIVDTMATEWAAKADALAGEGVVLSWGDESATITRDQLIWAMVITPQPGNPDEPFSLTFDQAILQQQLQPIADAVYKPADDVMLRLVDGEVKTEKEATEGREVDLEASAKAVNDAALDGSHKAALKISTIEPEYTSKDAKDLTFDDLLGDSSTYYGDSSEARQQNVERAVELEEGWIIPPGGVFSYYEVMGLVTEENGFVTGYGIVATPEGGVTTAPVIGGGICQVSTTMFQAAYWAGLEVVERYQHPYWLLAYGNPPRGMMGLDAMVNIEPDWQLDLKFRNTTDDWIAITMYADGENVGANIMGTDQGWTVDVAEPKFDNIVKADTKMVYEDTTELAPGEEKQVEYAKDGFDATIERRVTDENGNEVLRDTLTSTYAASRNLTLRGVSELESTAPAG
jgi:vancomycin resistance protein YoaR